MNSNNHTFVETKRAGFTILEILVAMSLLVLIVSIVYMSFSAVIQSTEDARAASFEMRMRQFLTRSFENNLSQVTEGWSPGSAYRTINITAEDERSGGPVAGAGRSRYWLDGKSDSLAFISTAPLAGNSGLPGSIKLVTYEVGTAESEEDILTDFGMEPQATLQVTETPLALSGTGLGGIGGAVEITREQITENAQRIGMDSVNWNIPIDSISFLYFDGDDWVDSWDSLLLERMPWAVDIRINFPKPPEEEVFDSDRNPEEDPDFRLVFTLPAGAGIRDAPPDYVRPEENIRERE